MVGYAAWNCLVKMTSSAGTTYFSSASPSFASAGALLRKSSTATFLSVTENLRLMRLVVDNAAQRNAAPRAIASSASKVLERVTPKLSTRSCWTNGTRVTPPMISKKLTCNLPSFINSGNFSTILRMGVKIASSKRGRRTS